MSAWVILLPAFVILTLIAASHVYLGLHVLARGIIFVDLALAQIVALGASLAFLFAHSAHGTEAQLLGLISGVIAALAFAQLRHLPDKTTREIVIGCVYVVATALSIVVLSRSTTGMEELKSLLNGSILWVGWSEIMLVAGVFGLLGLFHLIWRERFHQLSFAGEGAPGSGFRWEFLFFLSFAVVITLAVNIAGVLVVFAFLIIPAFSASIVTGGFLARLLAGWILAVLGGTAGLAVAYLGDLPVGATVVSTLGVLPIIAAVIAKVRTGHFLSTEA